MAVTDYKITGTATNETRSGSSQVWSNPFLAEADDGDFTTSILKNIGEFTDWLRCVNFGFTTGDIPSGSTIDGIEMQAEEDSNDAATDSSIRLRITSGQVGDDKATGSDWPTTPTLVTYGGAADDWSFGGDDGDIRSSDFGFDISAVATSANPTVLIDHVRVRVHYTEGGAPAVIPEVHMAPINQAA